MIAKTLKNFNQEDAFKNKLTPISPDWEEDSRFVKDLFAYTLKNDAAYQANYENFAGAFMADQPDTGRLFREYLLETMDSSESHNFIVATGGAYQGNAQQTEISTNMLEAIQELYGLTYDKTIEELIF